MLFLIRQENCILVILHREENYRSQIMLYALLCIGLVFYGFVLYYFSHERLTKIAYYLKVFVKVLSFNCGPHFIKDVIKLYHDFMLCKQFKNNWNDYLLDTYVDLRNVEIIILCNKAGY